MQENSRVPLTQQHGNGITLPMAKESSPSKNLMRTTNAEPITFQPYLDTDQESGSHRRSKSTPVDVKSQQTHPNSFEDAADEVTERVSIPSYQLTCHKTITNAQTYESCPMAPSHDTPRYSLVDPALKSFHTRPTSSASSKYMDVMSICSAKLHEAMPKLNHEWISLINGFDE